MSLINIIPDEIILSIYENYLSIYDKKLLNKKNYYIYKIIINNNAKKIQKLYRTYILKINIHMIYNLNIKYIRKYYIIKYPSEFKIKFIRLAGEKVNHTISNILYSELLFKLEYFYNPQINNKYKNINILINKYFIKCINSLEKHELEYIGW